MDSTAVLTIDEQAGAATRFTDELVRAFGLDGQRRGRGRRRRHRAARSTASGLGVLVGPKGATLQALEELVRAVVQHAAGGQSARLHLDVGGYRRTPAGGPGRLRRRRSPNEVREPGSERALEPMSPPDRKVVHDTVAELDGVETTLGGRGAPPAGRDQARVSGRPRSRPTRTRSSTSSNGPATAGYLGPGPVAAAPRATRAASPRWRADVLGRTPDRVVDLGTGGGRPRPGARRRLARQPRARSSKSGRRRAADLAAAAAELSALEAGSRSSRPGPRRWRTTRISASRSVLVTARSFARAGR